MLNQKSKPKKEIKAREKIKTRDIIQYQKDYYEKNKNKIRERRQRYNQTEQGKLNKKNAKNKRRALIGGSGVKIDELLVALKATHCYWCKKELVEKHIDHYIPVSKGGAHSLDNIVISCKSCNSQKRDKDPYEFAQKLGRLL